MSPNFTAITCNNTICVRFGNNVMVKLQNKNKNKNIWFWLIYIVFMTIIICWNDLMKKMPMFCWESQVVNFVFLLQIMVIKHYYILRNELKISTPSLINIKSSTCPTLLVLSLWVSTLTQLLFPCWSHYVIYWTSPITSFFSNGNGWQCVPKKIKINKMPLIKCKSSYPDGPSNWSLVYT